MAVMEFNILIFHSLTLFDKNHKFSSIHQTAYMIKKIILNFSHFFSQQVSVVIFPPSLTKGDNSLRGRLPPLARLDDMSIDKTWQSINIWNKFTKLHGYKKFLFTFDIAQTEQYIKVSKYTQIKKNHLCS